MITLVRDAHGDAAAPPAAAGVAGIGWALPSWRVGNDDIHGWSGLEPDFVTGKLGIESRRWLADDETPTDLAVRACEDLMRRHPGLDVGRVGLLVVVTQNPEYRLPHSSALLQHALGLPTGTACFDVNLGCSGWVYALTVVRGWMAAEGVGDALIVTCDPYSRAMRRQDRDVVGLFGDAATATWITAGGGAAIGLADVGTDGGGAEKLIIRAGGSGRPVQDVRTDPDAGPPPPDPAALALRMDGRAIFTFMMTRVPATVDACLARNGLARDDVDLYVFHQASRFLLEQLVQRAGLPADRVLIDMRDVGNTVSSTIPLTLARYAERRGAMCPAEVRRDPSRGGVVLVSGFGVGLSWATTVLRFPATG